MNQKLLNMICLNNILIVQHLLFWQKIFETKGKNKNNDFVNVIKSGLRDLKDEFKKNV